MYTHTHTHNIQNIRLCVCVQLHVLTVEMYLFADILIGLLRLRKCSRESYRPELGPDVSIVRELHVYPFSCV